MIFLTIIILLCNYSRKYHTLFSQCVEKLKVDPQEAQAQA